MPPILRRLRGRAQSQTTRSVRCAFGVATSLRPCCGVRVVAPRQRRVQVIRRSMRHHTRPDSWAESQATACCAWRCDAGLMARTSVAGKPTEDDGDACKTRPHRYTRQRWPPQDRTNEAAASRTIRTQRAWCVATQPRRRRARPASPPPAPRVATNVAPSVARPVQRVPQLPCKRCRPHSSHRSVAKRSEVCTTLQARRSSRPRPVSSSPARARGAPTPGW